MVAAVERARKKCGGVKMLIRGTGGILALSPFSNSESAVPAKQNPLAFRGRGVVRGSCTFTFINTPQWATLVSKDGEKGSNLCPVRRSNALLLAIRKA